MKMNAKEIKALTGASTRFQGEEKLYKQLVARKWFWAGHEANCAGFDRRKELVHFTATWAVEPGAVGHRRVGLPLKAALNNKDGVIDPDQAVILC